MIMLAKTMLTETSDKPMSLTSSQETFSDHYALIRAFREWSEVRSHSEKERAYCNKYFLSSSSMKTIADTKSKIHGELASLGIVDQGAKDNLNRNSLCWPLVKAVLVAGCYPNVLRVDLAKNQLVAARENNVRFHASSSLHPVAGIGTNHQRNIGNLPFEWIIYEELAKSSRHAAVKQATCVSSLSVALFAGSGRFLKPELPEEDAGLREELEQMLNDCDDADANPLAAYLDHLLEAGSETRNPSNHAILRVDEWVKFRGKPEAVNHFSLLKKHLQTLVLKRIRGQPFDADDERGLNIFKKILVERESLSVVETPRAMTIGSNEPGAYQRGRSSQPPSRSKRF